MLSRATVSHGENAERSTSQLDSKRLGACKELDLSCRIMEQTNDATTIQVGASSTWRASK
jgi:hypothetical protein